MQSLHPRLLGFLEGLCAASVTRYPEYGMFLRGLSFGSAVPPEPEGSRNASVHELREFFICVLSDTSVQRPQEGEYVVDQLLDVLKECHPHADVRFALPRHRGWFDGLEVWMNEPTGRCYFNLDWSAS